MLVHLGGFLVFVAALLAVAPTVAAAATQTRTDPSDAPAGAFGKADLRKVDWDVSGIAATLTVAVDASTYGTVNRAQIGVHVLIDTDGDGIADDEILATRNADGSRVDVTLRDLDQTLSTADCQDLAGQTAAQATVNTTLANGLETFTFSFDPTPVTGGLTGFRWAAFGQAPPDGAGPWDVMPDAANPDPDAVNPGDRLCNSQSGLRVRMSEGILFPDPFPAPTPPPPPTTAPTPPNQFTIGKPKLDTKSGVAKLTVEVPGPGELKLSGKEVEHKHKHAAGAGTVALAVKAKGDAKKDLTKRGKTKVRLSLTFTPTGGQPNTQTETVKLKRED